jgi:hypothetical protein
VGVAITRETLTIDLRPLANGGRGRVEAVYHLNNLGTETKLDLLFASGSPRVEEFEVTLDNKPVPAKPAGDAPYPQSWRPPRHTPAIGDSGSLGYLEYDALAAAPMAFTLVVPRGSHELTVRYAAEAAKHFFGEPTVYRQFAYVLAPARAWAEFGGLDVAIHLPQNWRAAITPEMERRGDTLQGSFDHLPADAIALTVQAPVGWAYHFIKWGGMLLFGLAGVGGAVWCSRRGLATGRRIAETTGKNSRWLERHAWPGSLRSGLAWSLAILTAGLTATLLPDAVLPRGQVNHYGYGQVLAALGVFALAILAAPVGFMIAQSTATIARRRWLRQPSPELAPAASDASSE